jgi:hypothetical protein
MFQRDIMPPSPRLVMKPDRTLLADFLYGLFFSLDDGGIMSL